jgi:uncharacterized protein (DUF2237 family)
MDQNVFGEPLEACSLAPRTGFFRDGCCRTDEKDSGQHTVCAIMTREFLDFSFRKGNDLINPRPQWDFPGLMPGDRWCLCAQRWMEAYRAGVAPSVVLEATHEKMLLFISLSELTKFAYRAPRPEIF